MHGYIHVYIYIHLIYVHTLLLTEIGARLLVAIAVPPVFHLSLKLRGAPKTSPKSQKIVERPHQQRGPIESTKIHTPNGRALCIGTPTRRSPIHRNSQRLRAFLVSSYPKAQSSPKALYDTVFGLKSLES